jgi:hypothetical protein
MDGGSAATCEGSAVEIEGSAAAHAGSGATNEGSGATNEGPCAMNEGAGGGRAGRWASTRGLGETDAADRSDVALSVGGRERSEKIPCDCVVGRGLTAATACVDHSRFNYE